MYFPSPAAPAQGTTIKFFLPSENRSNRFAGYYTIDRDIQQKKIIHVDLTGDTAGDAKRTEFIATEARHLKYNGDTSSIIAIHLSDKTSYSQFVELNNIMLRDGHKRYALWKKQFLYFVWRYHRTCNTPTDAAYRTLIFFNRIPL